MGEENKKKCELIHQELSYRIVGCAFRVQNDFGNGHKESLYQEAYEKELIAGGLEYKRESSLKIINPRTGEKMKSMYRPDFLVEDRVIIELKAMLKPPRLFIDQLYDYLRCSKYELGYLINFAYVPLDPVRIIYSNNKKFNN